RARGWPTVACSSPLRSPPKPGTSSATTPGPVRKPDSWRVSPTATSSRLTSCPRTTRMAELARRYDDFPLGTTDASVLALAERLDVTEIATTDRRHFAAVRVHHVDHLTLLPERLG